MKKDNARNIEINLNFEKGKINLEDRLAEAGDYDVIVRSYEKDRIKWETDRKAFKSELNHQQNEIEKLQDLVMTMRSKMKEQEDVTN